MSGPRSCTLSPRLTAWIVSATGWLTHLPNRQGLQYASAECGPTKNDFRSTSASRVSVPACRTRAAGLRTRGSSGGDAGIAGCLLQGVGLMGIDGTVAPVGVVIRRGPSKSVCTLLWDRRRDGFPLAQWMFIETGELAGWVKRQLSDEDLPICGGSRSTTRKRALSGRAATHN